MDFETRYKKLNIAQREAVDTIDGPVMVVAGPGTGKTELLSVRTANILQKTDTLPENILCLTFTESGATAMRERLTEIIGKEAYKVAIHTFHSFGSEIINQNGQYFYQGAHFMPANELSSYEIIKEIFKELAYSNPLSSKLNDEYTHLSDALTIISELKKSGFTSGELLSILDDNDVVIEKVEQLLSPIFLNGINKTTAPETAKHINAIAEMSINKTNKLATPLSKIVADSLALASADAIALNSTKPITAWRNEWFKKDQTGNFIMKSRERQIKLRGMCYIYETYLSKMQAASLYDFDDMILRVVHTLETHDDLRFNLQEKYQYIMVDEFQDTNMAQMRILHNLTNNELAHGDTPNILVVGDDDQAIYSFQGADVSNIINFRTDYAKAKLITLTDNYRSSEDILSGSRDIILQGRNRLENIFKDINKELVALNNYSDKVNIREAEDIATERHFIVNDIKSKINSGINANDITVLTRRHSEIGMLLPYFAKAGIAVNYERQDNVLESPLIILIEQVSRLLIDLSTGLHDQVNAALPAILAHKAWGIKPIDLWRLSLTAYDKRVRWMDIMETDPLFTNLHSWLVETASIIENEPLEQVLDIIIGKQASDDNKEDKFVSPIFNYFFSKENLQNNPSNYLVYIESLRTIRSELKEYLPNSIPTLNTFIEFINLNRKIGRTISNSLHVAGAEDAINIMTTHKSKGLEFDIVYIVNAVDSTWGEKARSRNRLISYPENLPLSPAGESEDERLRLFYVAATRAKKQLNVSYSLLNDNNKSTLIASFLVNSAWHITNINKADNQQITEIAETAWYQPIINPITLDMKQLLQPKLEKYLLSITHMHSFLDITRGGPDVFLLQNLLHFPSSKSPNAAFGTAIHNTLQQAHVHLSATGESQAIEDILLNFEKNLNSQHMLQIDLKKYLEKGTNALQNFLDEKYSTFNQSQVTELNFANQHCIIDDAHITGKLDLVDINKLDKTFTITDYKTGKPSYSWRGKDEFEKIKLHKYKQQLLFYKLLVENSRDYHNYKVVSGIMQFVEPTKANEIISLNTEFNDEDLDQFKKLIKAVWTRIKSNQLPDTSNYDKTYSGILAFEQDLIDNNI